MADEEGLESPFSKNFEPQAFGYGIPMSEAHKRWLAAVEAAKPARERRRDERAVRLWKLGFAEKEWAMIDIERNFTYHIPKEGQPEKCGALRGQAKELAYSIAQLCPESREQALALTKLEEVIFWANAAITRNE